MPGSGLKGSALTASAAAAAGLRVNQDGVRRTGLDLLAFPGIDVARLATIWPELERRCAPDVAEQIEIEARYRGYLDRQAADIAGVPA